MCPTVRRVVWIVTLIVVMPAVVHAQRSDVVEVTNGDRITGTVSRLLRGRLEFRTDSAGTLSIIWEQVVRLTSAENLDIELQSGERFSGTISSPSSGQLVVQTASGPSRPIDMKQIVLMTSIAEGFRGRTTGSLDFGLNFTNSQSARTYTLNGEALHRSAAHMYETQVKFDSWLAARDDVERLTRNALTVDVRRRLARRWFAVATIEGQQDEQLELDVRLLVAGGVGRMLIHSQRSHLAVSGGLDYDGEQYDSVGSFDHSVELFGDVVWDWFARDSVTEAKVEATTYVSLARQRLRLEWDSSLRRDIFWDLYWAVNITESFDSDPPDDRPRSDFLLSFTLGWSF